MSALVRITNSSRTSRHFRKGPKRRHGIASANEKRPPQLAASFPILELTWARLCTQMAGYIENAETPETA